MISQSDSSRLNRSGTLWWSDNLLPRVAVVVVVCVAVIGWPEQLAPIALPLAFLLSMALAWLSSANFCRVFICAFLVATATALVVYLSTAHLGLFEASLQDSQSGVSDSQFFLYETRRFLSERDPSALFSSWASLVPVLYGAIALEVFGGHYLGIVFANCLLYSVTVFSAARLLGIPRLGYRLLPLLGLLPLQGLYNSMLAKEPIYLFLVVVALDAFFGAIASKRLSWGSLFLFAGLTLVTIIFRPTGAMIVGLVILFVVARRPGLARAWFLLTAFAATVAIAVGFANVIDFPLPLFFLGNEGVDFSNQVSFSSQAIESRLASESLAPLFLPPWSIIASPLLGALWMVSPLPLMGNLVDAFSSLLAGDFSFAKLAVMNRYLDAILMTALLMGLFVRRARINRAVVFNPLTLLGIAHVLGIVAFEFFESGRHRYLPGFVLAMLVVAIMGKRNKASNHPFVGGRSG